MKKSQDFTLTGEEIIDAVGRYLLQTGIIKVGEFDRIFCDNMPKWNLKFTVTKENVQPLIKEEKDENKDRKLNLG